MAFGCLRVRWISHSRLQDSLNATVSTIPEVRVLTHSVGLSDADNKKAADRLVDGLDKVRPQRGSCSQTGARAADRVRLQGEPTTPDRHMRSSVRVYESRHVGE